MFRQGAQSALAACLLVTMQTAGAQATNAKDTAAPAAAAVPDDYRMGPGDTLQIFVWRNPDLTVTVPVRPDGKISTPLVSDMVVVGKTPSQLAHDIEQVLAEYIREPRVNVIVTQPVAAFSQVKVVGQVLHPQAVAYHDGMTLLDLILQAGGLGEFAAGNRARLVRSEAGKSVELHVRLADLMKKGDLKQNLALKPGDIIIVPESLF
jgi:polysaccharide export outer membrane protein